jgi:ATP-dependent DNA helicase RecG
MKKSVDSPIQYLKGIGPKRAQALERLGIKNIEDLLYYFPRRYEDRTSFVPITQLEEGKFQTVKAQILAKGQRQSFFRKGFHILEVTVGDDTGKISCVWFNQPYLKEYFKVGESLILYGRIDRYEDRLQISNPEFENVTLDSDESLNIGRIVPVYLLGEGISQRYFRKVMKNSLDAYLPYLNECLPYPIRSKNNLLNLVKSLLNIHFPESLDLQKQAFERLCFEEFFLFQLLVVLRKKKKKEKQGIEHAPEGKLVDNIISSLPFKLTASQLKVLEEIKHDLSQPLPMQRLLQGDVGSGKTVVSVIASFMVMQGGYQVAFMVPTEVLARQHYQNITAQCPAVFDQRPGGLKIGLLTSSAAKKEKERIYGDIKEGRIGLVIGTHALIEEAVQFKNLGLVIIDEQHKFGVGQRALLPKKGPNPDCLIMTATPIPRTLAITIYGDLDLSVITELPTGRKPVQTVYFPYQERKKAYEIALGQLSQARQVYIVYPVIEESYALDMAGAQKSYEELKKKEFKDFKVSLLHGRLKQEEQERIMSLFRKGEIDVLVATTVLEVGIDVPNATCMIVEHAERFGLSQLHQLRGRVGRGEKQSFCILLARAQTQEAKSRLEAMVKYQDGFRIAERDLKIRGPGEFFGRRQHGLSELKIGDPLTQMQLLKRAREEAVKVLNEDSLLAARQNSLLKERLEKRFPEASNLMFVG